MDTRSLETHLFTVLNSEFHYEFCFITYGYAAYRRMVHLLDAVTPFISGLCYSDEFIDLSECSVGSELKSGSILDALTELTGIISRCSIVPPRLILHRAFLECVTTIGTWEIIVELDEYREYLHALVTACYAYDECSQALA